MIKLAMTTTANDLTGHKLMRSLGVVRGVVVRSRSVIGNIGAAIQTLFGGNIAQGLGANAVIGLRYDAPPSS